MTNMLGSLSIDINSIAYVFFFAMCRTYKNIQKGNDQYGMGLCVVFSISFELLFICSCFVGFFCFRIS